MSVLTASCCYCLCVFRPKHQNSHHLQARRDSRCPFQGLRVVTLNMFSTQKSKITPPASEERLLFSLLIASCCYFFVFLGPKNKKSHHMQARRGFRCLLSVVRCLLSGVVSFDWFVFKVVLGLTFKLFLKLFPNLVLFN